MFDISHLGELGLCRQWPDGSPEIGTGLEKKKYFEAYSQTPQRLDDVGPIGKDPEEPDTTDSESDDDQPASSQPRMTRQEAKQLDRELPWREIITMPQAHVQKFLQAIEKEANSWMEWRSIKPLTDAEIAEIKGDAVLRRRVMKSRAAYRDKNRQRGDLKAKCRIVVLGHNDPDLFSITRSAPTPGRATEHMLFSMITAGMNGELGSTSHRWKAWLADAQTAFLQGSQEDSERTMPLFMAAPRDPLIDKTPFWKTEIYQILGNVYGLPNAPHLWSEEVGKRLLGLGYRRHSFDKMLFLRYDPASPDDIMSMIMGYVDDFLGVHRQDYPIQEVHDAFRWGDLNYLNKDEEHTFKGKQLKVILNDEGRYILKISMHKFIETIEPYKIPRGRLNQDHSLTDQERRDFRSVSGCLQWLGSQARPELCPAVSLSNHGLETDINHLKTLYETVDYVKSTPFQGITIQDVPMNKDTLLVTYTDASWSNAAHSTSQQGILVVATSPEATQKTCRASVLDWRSSRSQRVCRSTLAAEASAADEGSDRAAFLNMLIAEIFYNQAAWKIGSRLDHIQVTDARSLYDCIISPNPSMSDKRSLVNVRAIQEEVRPDQTWWVPTTLMFADGLTKLNINLRSALADWLMSPFVKLRDAEGPKKNIAVKKSNMDHAVSNS